MLYSSQATLPLNARFTSSFKRRILLGAIAPAALAFTPASAVDLVVPPNQTINTSTATATFAEGLLEGFVGGARNLTDPNPGNSSPELTLRMGQTQAQGADLWADNRTWIYTGQINTGPNGTLSFAANNDDADWFKINGVVVLDDNGWDTAAAGVVTGLTPNTFVDFEYRVGNGGGGAGPSAQNGPIATTTPPTVGPSAGWTATRGVVMSHNNEANSADANNYIGGPNDLGQPTEPAAAGAQLFRYATGFFLDTDLKVDGTGTLTVDGTNAAVTLNSLQFRNTTPATFTINDGTGGHKTLLIGGATTLATTTAQSVVIAGSSDLRLGQITDGSASGSTLTYSGTGVLSLEANAASDLNGTTLGVTSGTLSVVGNGASPLVGMTAPINVAGGTLRIGSSTGNTTFDHAINVTGSATLQHTAGTTDTLGSATRGITIASGQTLTANISGGQLNVAGGINSGGPAAGGLTKAGGNTMVVNGPVSLANLTVNAGRLELNGVTTLGAAPSLTGGTLALRNGGNTITGALTVAPNSTLEIVPGGAGATNTLNLTGGTLSLVASTNGLRGEFYNVAPPNENNRHPQFGPEDLTPTSANFQTFTTHFTTTLPTQGTPQIALTSANGKGDLNFPNADADLPPFGSIGVPFGNNIQARLTGSFFATAAGLYSFGTTSDDGSVLFIDGQSVVNNNRFQGMTRRNGSIFLQPGAHEIQIGFYEGTGGAGLIVNYTPPGAGDQILQNSALLPNAAGLTFENPLNVTGDATINTTGQTNVPSMTLTPGRTLTVNNGGLTAGTTTFNGAGTYTVAGNGLLTVTGTADSGADIDIVKNGTGSLFFSSPATARFSNAGSSVTVNSGTVGLVIGGLNPIGAATLTMAPGAGLALSSTGGNQTFALPAINGGTISAGRFANGVAGPVTISTTGTVEATQGRMLVLGSSDGYTLNVSGTTINLNGGTLRAAGGLVDIGNAVVNVTPLTIASNPNALTGRFLNTGPGEFVPSLYNPTNDAGIKSALTLPASVVKERTGEIAFPNDAAFDTFFDPGATTDQRYNASFLGNLNVPTGGGGAFQFQITGVDDSGAFWVDLNQNGVFEAAGSSGDERISQRGCCGDAGAGTANLIGGQVYRVAIAVEDTGGGGSITGKFKRPSDAGLINVNPGDAGQAGLFSSYLASGGASVEVAGGGELRIPNISQFNEAVVDGTLRLTTTTVGTSTIETLRSTAGGRLVLDVTNLTVNRLTLNQNTTLVKAGAGTLTANAQSFGNGSTFSVEAGLAILNGGTANLASNGTANGGGVAVSGTGILQVSGAISGSATVNGGGTLRGTGTVGATTLNGGTIAPGNSPGTLTTGNLTLNSGTLSIEINGLTAGTEYDVLNVVGTVNLANNIELSISLGTFNPADNGTQSFTIIANDDTDAITGTGLFTRNGVVLAEGSEFQAGVQPFRISYAGGTNANDVVLTAIPEPATWTVLMSGFGLLVGLQRFRRQAR